MATNVLYKVRSGRLATSRSCYLRRPEISDGVRAPACKEGQLGSHPTPFWESAPGSAWRPASWRHCEESGRKDVSRCRRRCASGGRRFSIAASVSTADYPCAFSFEASTRNGTVPKSAPHQGQKLIGVALRDVSNSDTGLWQHNQNVVVLGGI